MFSLNLDIASKLQQISELYLIKPDKRRHISYSNASSAIAQSLEEIKSGADAQKIKGVGKSVAADIDSYLNTGIIPRETELKFSLGDKIDVIELFMGVFDIGPVKAINFYEKGYRSLDNLYQDPGLTESQRLGIIYYQHLKQRLSRLDIDFVKTRIEHIFTALELAYGKAGYTNNLEWEIVGSYRRGSPDSGDIDILVKDNMVPLLTLVETLTLNNLIVGNLKLGLIKYLGIFRIDSIHNAGRIDITMVKPENWTYAKLHATGSKKLNIQMRQKAIEMGFTLNEMGLFDSVGQLRPANNEQQIFNYLGLDYLEPTQRNL